MAARWHYISRRHYIFFKERAGARSFFAPAVSAGAKLPMLIERDGGRPTGGTGRAKLCACRAGGARSANFFRIIYFITNLLQHSVKIYYKCLLKWRQ